MNPRQRRGLLLLGVAALGAVALLVTLYNYVAQVGSQVGPLTTALQLTADRAAFEPLDGAVREVQIPRRYLPDQAFRTPADVEGLVASADLPAGVMLQQGMLVPPPVAAPGERYVSLQVTPEMGRAELLQPGSRVDVVGTFREPEQPAEVQIVIQAARVVDSSAATPGGPELPGPADPEDPEAEDEEVAPELAVASRAVTFALTVEDALRVAYVQDVAETMRLFIRPAGDLAEVPEAGRRYQPVRPGEGR